jgi:hypothetical protein
MACVDHVPERSQLPNRFPPKKACASAFYPRPRRTETSLGRRAVLVSLTCADGSSGLVPDLCSRHVRALRTLIDGAGGFLPGLPLECLDTGDRHFVAPARAGLRIPPTNPTPAAAAAFHLIAAPFRRAWTLTVPSHNPSWRSCKRPSSSPWVVAASWPSPAEPARQFSYLIKRSPGGGVWERMDANTYMSVFVEPMIRDLEGNPSSPRHAFFGVSRNVSLHRLHFAPEIACESAGPVPGRKC